MKRALFSTRIDIGGMCALIVGPPGSGKGTMSARLTDDFGFVPLASGDAFRAQIADGTCKIQLFCRLLTLLSLNESSPMCRLIMMAGASRRLNVPPSCHVWINLFQYTFGPCLLVLA